MPLAIAGNELSGAGAAREIDASDSVIRSDHPPYLPLKAGRSADVPFLTISGRDAQRLLSDPGNLQHSAAARLRRSILPRYPVIIAHCNRKPGVPKRRQASWTGRAIAGGFEKSQARA